MGQERTHAPQQNFVIRSPCRRAPAAAIDEMAHPREAFLVAVNIAKLPSVPRQILKDIPRRQIQPAGKIEWAGGVSLPLAAHKGVHSPAL
jgi:hypothetical protein